MVRLNTDSVACERHPEHPQTPSMYVSQSLDILLGPAGKRKGEIDYRADQGLSFEAKAAKKRDYLVLPCM